jgi:AcrR family transcriptional regulator
MPPTIPNAERRATTRRKLTDAAIATVARRGFHAATVDAIAEAAGYSVGAIYSNFGSKDDLFLAVFDEHLAWFESVLADVPDDLAPLERLLDERDQLLVFMEFWGHAVRTPKVKRRFAQRMARMRGHVAALIQQRAQAQGIELDDATAERFALLALALARGVALERLADPRAVPDGLLSASLDGLLAGR